MQASEDVHSRDLQWRARRFAVQMKAEHELRRHAMATGGPSQRWLGTKLAPPAGRRR